MFLKEEKPEIDDCEKNTLDTLAKSSQNIFLYSFVSDHSKHFLFIFRKKNIFSGGGSTPPPH